MEQLEKLTREEALKRLKATQEAKERRIAILRQRMCEKSKADRSLTQEEGERLVKRTLIPALKEVMEAREKGIKYPDAHDLLTLL